MNSCSSRSKSLRRLSDTALLHQLEKLRGAERAAQHRIVLYLAEVERRRLYLPKGYGSLFEYCTGSLGYSRSSAGRRIGAARCIARFPRMAALFRRGECEVTVLAAIAPIVTKENCAELARWLRGKSLREVEAYVTRREPERMLRDRVREVYVMSPEPAGTSLKNSALLATAEAAAPGDIETTGGDRRSGAESRDNIMLTPSGGSKTAQPIDNTQDGICDIHAGAGTICSAPAGASSTCSAPAGTGPDCPELTGAGPTCSALAAVGSARRALTGAAPAERVALKRKFKLQFAVEPEFMEKLARVKSLLSTKYPKGMDFQMIFTILMSEYIDRHDPEKRTQRRKVRRDRTRSGNVRSKGTAGGGPAGKAPGHTGEQSRKSAERTRHIPQEIRDEVFKRDGGRCSFIGPDGRRCGSRWDLEIDHIIPYAKGGSNSPANLRLLCARHNISEAEREYGTQLMGRYRRRE